VIEQLDPFEVVHVLSGVSGVLPSASEGEPWKNSNLTVVGAGNGSPN
jgi:hypothetical protein